MPLFSKNTPIEQLYKYVEQIMNLTLCYFSKIIVGSYVLLRKFISELIFLCTLKLCKCFQNKICLDECKNCCLAGEKLGREVAEAM
jgi:hypothetical protein